MAGAFAESSRQPLAKHQPGGLWLAWAWRVGGKGFACGWASADDLQQAVVSIEMEVDPAHWNRNLRTSLSCAEQVTGLGAVRTSPITQHDAPVQAGQFTQVRTRTACAQQVPGLGAVAQRACSQDHTTVLSHKPAALHSGWRARR